MADKHKFSFKFMDRMDTDQTGKDFTIYFTDLASYKKAINELKYLCQEIKAFNNNQGFDDYLRLRTKSDGLS